MYTQEMARELRFLYAPHDVPTVLPTVGFMDYLGPDGEFFQVAGGGDGQGGNVQAGDAPRRSKSSFPKPLICTAIRRIPASSSADQGNEQCDLIGADGEVGGWQGAVADKAEMYKQEMAHASGDSDDDAPR